MIPRHDTLCRVMYRRIRRKLRYNRMVFFLISVIIKSFDS
jgi:hypothetical protein